MHEWRSLIITSDFNVICIILCRLILRQLQRRMTSHLPRNLLKNTKRDQNLDQYQNSGLYLVIFFRRLWVGSKLWQNRSKKKSRKLEKKRWTILQEYCGRWVRMFLNMNLTGRDTFPPEMNKRPKLRFNQNNSMWKKAMHFQNCNKKWLEHSHCPYIARGTSW